MTLPARFIKHDFVYLEGSCYKDYFTFHILTFFTKIISLFPQLNNRTIFKLIKKTRLLLQPGFIITEYLSSYLRRFKLYCFRLEGLIKWSTRYVIGIITDRFQCNDQVYFQYILFGVTGVNK